jgi:hypothetical protein
MRTSPNGSRAAFQGAALAAGVPTPALRRTREGELIADCGGVRVRLHAWVDLHDPDPSLDPRDVGRLVAGLHRVDFAGTIGLDPRYTEAPDTFISGHGQVVGDHITVELTMRGQVNGSSTVSVPINRAFEMTEGPASALVGQICRTKDEPASPPPPPANGPALGYRGSLSGSATITSASGVMTETWSSTDVRFSRTYPASDAAPNYQISEGNLQFSVSGTVGGCTISGSDSFPLGADDGAAESTLDLAPDDSYYAVGFPGATLDVTYTCPGSDPFTVPYAAMNEFLRTNPPVVRRQPSPNGTISGSASAVSGPSPVGESKALKWSWALKPQL